ncbi:MAG: FxDxF family PEP-CTERM protein [Steroidobacteraceae bacterium]
MTVLSALTVTAGLCLAQAGNASAATLSYEETASGITGSGAVTAYSALPVSDFFGNNLGPSSGTLGSPADPGFTFYDDFVFTVASSTVDAASFLLNEGSTLSIDDLQMRLYSTTGNTLPVLGDSPAGLQAGWSTPISSNGVTTNLPTTMLTSGAYVLEVRGAVTGAAGGSYAGLIDLQPVPLPAALPLMLSGLGLLGGMVRKRFAT